MDSKGLISEKIYLEEFLSESQIKSDTLVAVAERFSKNEMHEQAQRILNIAYKSDGNNQRCLK